MSTKPEPSRSTPDARMIDVRDLAIGWGSDVLAKDLTFDVARGEIFAVLGGSGSGKSTLLRFLVGLERPLAGEVCVAGKRGFELDGGLPPFGVMFQHGALFGSMTVAENVLLPLEEWTDLPPDAALAIAHAKLRLVGLAGAADKLPSEISGGMTKRAAIARALAREPELVFLDEPSSGLDPVLSAELDDLVLTLREALGLTVVVVTHDLESVFAIADRCLLLDKETRGAIAVGDPRELRESEDERVRRFFNPRRKER